MNSALSTATMRTYHTALQCFLTFVTMCGIVYTPGTLPIVSEDIMLHFCTYCQQVLNLKYCTIKLYLAGVKYYYVCKGYVDPTANRNRLNYVLRGIQKSQDNTKKVRLPITFTILQEMCELLGKGVFDVRTDLMLQNVFSMAFFGFMRCAEVTVKSLKDKDFIKMSDVNVHENLYKYTVLLTSKCDPFRRGVTIDIFNNDKLYPVTLMQRYIELRKTNGATAQSPLFVDFQNFTRQFECLNRDRFIYYLRYVLCCLGYTDSKYCGHSFRIGAATSAGAAGVPDHIIQTLGRWSSDCYMRYIRTDTSCIKKAQDNMCGSGSR